MKLKTLTIFALFSIGIFTIAEAKEGFSETKTQQRPLAIRKQAFTPGLRLNGYTFYAFDDKVDSYYSNTEYFNGTIKGGFQWGGGLEYMMSISQSFELSYLRLDTNAPMKYYKDGIQDVDFDVATNYIFLGSNRYFPIGGKIEPYAGLQAGMAILNVTNPNNGNSTNATKFAWGFKLGTNIWASDNIGLKIQTGVLSAVQAAGGGLYFGTGGAGAGVSTYSSFYQFYIGGGLTFNFAQ